MPSSKLNFTTLLSADSNALKLDRDWRPNNAIFTELNAVNEMSARTQCDLSALLGYTVE
jgi:hypothetical protein